MNYLDFIEFYQIPVSYQHCPYEYGNYDGNIINLKGLKAKQILHEICHYIIASKNQRKLIDYGLGVGPNTNLVIYKDFFNSKKNNITKKQSLVQETQVCILEFLFAAIVGLDLLEYLKERNFVYISYSFQKRKKYYFSVEIPHWHENDFYKEIKKMIRKKVINKNWIPMVLLPYLKLKDLQAIKKFQNFIATI